MKVFAKIAKWAGITLLGLIVLLATAVLAVLIRPQIILNEKTLRAAAEQARRFNAELRWSAEEIRVESLGLAHKKIFISFNELHFAFIDGSTRVDLKRVEAAAEFKFNFKGFKVLELGPVLAEGDLALHLKKSADGPKPKNEPANPFEIKTPEIVLPDFLKPAVFKTISVDLTRIEAKKDGEDLFLGKAKVWGEGEADGRLRALNFEASVEEGFKVKTGGAEGRVESVSGFLKNDAIVHLSAATTLASGEAVKAEAEAYKDLEKGYTYRLKAQFEKKPIIVKAAVHGTLGNKEWLATVESNVQGVGQDIQNITTQNCILKVQQSPESDKRQKLDLNCPVTLQMTPFNPPPAPYSGIGSAPNKFSAILTATADAAVLPTPQMDQPISGSAKIDLVSFSQKFATVSGNVQTRFKGVPGQYPEGWEVLTDLDLKLGLQHFQKLVSVLHRTDFAVPAPVNALEGTIAVELKGRANLTRKNGQVPIEFKTNLSSKEQSLKTEGKGNLTYEYAPDYLGSHLVFNLQLTDVQLALPTLGYSPPPQLIADNRIRTGPPKPPSRKIKDFTYEIKITTPDKPVLVKTNLISTPIPVELDVRLMKQGMDGTIRIAPTAIEFFRRKANVKEIKITLQNPTKLSEVDGLVQVRYTNYLVNVRLLGNLDRTRIILESRPDLPEDEIISLLIYGRTYDSLDQTEAESASSASQAFMSRAVGLSTFFLLSSTPVERIEYNPDSGTFAAHFRLGKGTSFNVGTTQNKGERVGIKKTLKKNWIINTYVENDPEEKKQTATGFLEWVKRY